MQSLGLECCAVSNFYSAGIKFTSTVEQVRTLAIGDPNGVFCTAGVFCSAVLGIERCIWRIELRSSPLERPTPFEFRNQNRK